MYEYLLKRYFILIKNPFIKLDYLFIYIYNKIKLLLLLFLIKLIIILLNQ